MKIQNILMRSRLFCTTRITELGPFLLVGRVIRANLKYGFLRSLFGHLYMTCLTKNREISQGNPYFLKLFSSVRSRVIFRFILCLLVEGRFISITIFWASSVTVKTNTYCCYVNSLSSLAADSFRRVLLLFEVVDKNTKIWPLCDFIIKTDLVSIWSITN